MDHSRHTAEIVPRSLNVKNPFVDLEKSVGTFKTLLKAKYFVPTQPSIPFSKSVCPGCLFLSHFYIYFYIFQFILVLNMNDIFAAGR